MTSTRSGTLLGVGLIAFSTLLLEVDLTRRIGRGDFA